MRIPALYLTSITCGFCLMALEIMGARMLFPSFGSSIDVWAAIIAVFILSLSVGYVLGGRIADRTTGNATLGWVIVGAAAMYLLLPAWAQPFCESLGKDIHTARWGVLLAAMVLFFPPSLLLGMISPMLVKLVFVSAERVGTTTGTLYAIGSVGNVLGILVTDFVLLAYVEINPAIWAMGIVMALLGLAHIFVRISAAPSTGGTTTVAAAGAP